MSSTSCPKNLVQYTGEDRVDTLERPERNTDERHLGVLAKQLSERPPHPGPHTLVVEGDVPRREHGETRSVLGAIRLARGHEPHDPDAEDEADDPADDAPSPVKIGRMKKAPGP
jgi:hypothetical protein